MFTHGVGQPVVSVSSTLGGRFVSERHHTPAVNTLQTLRNSLRLGAYLAAEGRVGEDDVEEGGRAFGVWWVVMRRANRWL